MNTTVTAPSVSTELPRPSRPRNVTSAVATIGSWFGGRTRGSSFAPAGTRMTGKVAVLLLTTPVATVPAGTSTRCRT